MGTLSPEFPLLSPCLQRGQIISRISNLKWKLCPSWLADISPLSLNIVLKHEREGNFAGGKRIPRGVHICVVFML